tara:strand:+ start:284 stop:484 length:201 start_codon:yes stop_codon:yes gene_type:complete
MIIYEVSFKDIDGTKQSVYFPNRRTANAFVAQNKKSLKKIKVTLHGVESTKTEIISFLNRGNKIHG